MATHSSILAWRTPWTEESGMLHSIGSQRVGHDLVTEQPGAYVRNHLRDLSVCLSLFTMLPPALEAPSLWCKKMENVSLVI